MRKPILLTLPLALELTLFLASAQPVSVPDVSHLAVPGGTIALVDSRLKPLQGEVEIVVRLGDAPLAVAHGNGAKKLGGTLTKAQQRAHVAGLSQKQDDLVRAARGMGGRELARLSKSLNAVILKVDASRIPAIAALPNVVSIRPVPNYKLDLAETVPYIGAKAVQTAGFNGSGVTVAVIDSGIDYTHKEFGGPGTPEAYEAAYGAGTDDVKNTTTDALFPTAKVIGGFDFVGEEWPEGPLAPDPDPIDFEGHGTHVSDIIGGISGVAPGVKLIACKACSAVATACSGVALLEAAGGRLEPGLFHRRAIRRSCRRFRGQRSRPAVHRRLAKHHTRRDQRRPDASAKREALSARDQCAGGHCRSIREQRNRRLGAGRQRIHC